MQDNAPRSIVWRLAWGVVALQTALLLGWVIYRVYQPVLLDKYQLKSLLFIFTILPGGLSALIEPLSGWLSDQLDLRYKARLLPISSGVLVTGLIFVSVAVLLAQESARGRGVLPILMVIWMIAVQVCASPSLALLHQTAPARRLPQVTALLTLSSGAIGALEPLLGRWASRIGPSQTFLLGAIVLGVGWGVLRSVALQPGRSPIQSLSSRPSAFPVGPAILLFVVGLSVGFETNVLLFLLPRVRLIHLAGLPNEAITSALLMLSALVAPGMGRLATRWGDRPCLLGGIVGMTVLLGFALVLPGGLLPLCLVGLGGLLSLVATSLIAISLDRLPPAHTGLGSGLYLGSQGAAAALAIALFGPKGPVALSPVLLGLGLAASLALWSSSQLAKDLG